MLPVSALQRPGVFFLRKCNYLKKKFVYISERVKLAIRGECLMKRRGLSLLATTILLSILVGCTSPGDVDMETQAETVEYIYDNNMVQTSTDSRVAFSEKGYYYLVNGFLHFYDINSSVGIPVCSKSDCLHDSTTCGAYALDKADYDPANLSEVSVNCTGNMIWYDNGKLYMVKRDESGDYLMQYDSDFTNEVKLCTLADDGTIMGMPSSDTQDTALMYKGYFYYYTVTPTNAKELVDYTTTISCNRIKVESNAKREVLGSFDMAMDYSMFGSGANGKVCGGKDCVYFVSGGTERFLSDNNPVQYRICSYDCVNDTFSVVLNKNADNAQDILGEKTGEVLEVNKDIVCVDDDNNIYIVTGNNKVVKISASGGAEVVYSNVEAQEISSLIWDGSHVYFYERTQGNGSIVRLNKQGSIDGRYAVTISKKFCDEHKISGDLSLGICIYGVDAQNILVGTTDNYIKGLECETLITNHTKSVNTYAIGVISKDVFKDSSVAIKKIYEYSGYLHIQ